MSDDLITAKGGLLQEVTFDGATLTITKPRGELITVPVSRITRVDVKLARRFWTLGWLRVFSTSGPRPIEVSFRLPNQPDFLALHQALLDAIA